VTGEKPGTRFRSALLLAATIVVGAAGPALIVYDRWFGLRRSDRFLSAFADRWPFLKNLNLPDYAVLILGAFLLLFLLGRLRATETADAWRSHRAFALRPRRPSAAGSVRAFATGAAVLGGGASALMLLRLIVTKRQPALELFFSLCLFAAGMILREVSIAALARVWRRSRGNLLSILAAHVAVILALASHYSFHRFEALLVAVALLAAGNLAARFRKTGPVPLIVLVFVVLYTWRVDAWWFVLVGDEYRNFDIAERIVNEHDRAYITSHLFQLEGGLEGLDPYADSLVQAATMRLLGVNNFGWKFSSLYFAAIALAFFHRFFRTFLTKRAALVTTVCLGASHYIMSFGKIGYDKFQAYLAMALLLAATGCAIRARRTIAFLGIGFAAALCFYVYPAALYIVPFPFFLLLLYAPPVDRSTLLRWGVAALAAGLTVFPLPFQPTYFEGKRPGTVFYNPELGRSAANLFGHFGRNLVYAGYSPLVLASEDHYVTCSYLDPLTGLFYMVGLASALWLVRRDRFTAFVVVGLGWLMFFGGATHDREYPPTTRMFLLLPLFVLVATLGLARLSVLGRSAGVSSRVAGAALWATLGAILALNVIQTHVVSRRRSDGYEIFDPLVVQVGRRIASLPPPRLRLLFLSESPGEGSGIPMILRSYSLDKSLDFSEIPVPEGVLSSSDRARVADPANAVFVSTRLLPNLRHELEREIAATGKTPCSVLTSTGHERFKLWAAPGVPNLCAD
jgi:hypothetical protein